MTCQLSEDSRQQSALLSSRGSSYLESSPFKTKQSGHTYFKTVDASCEFNQDIFHDIMENLIRNPNITSSHLFRADVFWDSEKDSSFSVSAEGHLTSSFVQHMKSDLRPIELYEVEGYQLKRSLVRQLIPRNTKLDRPLVQTCHFYRSVEEEAYQRSLIFYIPHVDNVDDIPWYHPPVKGLAFLHSGHTEQEQVDTELLSLNTQSISIHASFFELGIGSIQPQNRLDRTLEKLMSTIIKHGKGKLTGYKKRVHHDNIVPQARLQDTYTRLKNRHAKTLLNLWNEQTDATKGVFEDLGIAAFLIELWSDMYAHDVPFPGFVDIACGNGVLVYILRQEGYQGWGFDARERKTWISFPSDVQENLKPLVFVPQIFTEALNQNSGSNFPAVHNGIFGNGTFIVSNHADELTMWTPLLAYMNFDAPFIAIPCCSHDFAGAKTRFSAGSKAREEWQCGPQAPDVPVKDCPHSEKSAKCMKCNGQLHKQASAYSSLCSAVSSTTSLVGYVPEAEMLRIPSTRNFAVIGRERTLPNPEGPVIEDFTDRIALVTRIIEKEMSRSIADIGAEWIERAEKLVNSKGRNH